jgi:cytidine deaminase
MNRRTVLAGLVSLPVARLAGAQETPMSLWKLRPESEALVPDAKLRAQIFRALDAAKNAGNDPSISHFPVRAATVVGLGGVEHVVLGGNTEYAIPEAIHGESSMLNHVTALFGPQVTRDKVRFVAYYQEVCGTSGSCGDCRDYQLATTDYERLLVVCGQGRDHTVGVTRFRDQLVFERDFPAVDAAKIPLEKAELDRLVASAQVAREGGVTLFTGARHTGAAGVTFSGKTYRAAGADDAAFHYRYPIGGLLQQAATERDYFLRVIVVAAEKGQWPVINYRDRQYGFEASSFNQREGKPPIVLVLTDGQGNFRMTTFEQALPAAFSTSDFMPQAVTDFLKTHARKD